MIFESSKSSPAEKDQTIQRWLTERQKLFVHFNTLAALSNSKKQVSSKPLTKAMFETFFQSLIDYLAMGHFCIFEQLLGKSLDENDTIKGIDPKILDNIQATTIRVLDFHDKYMYVIEHADLKNDLGALGENLAHRVELEDVLIGQYLKQL